MNETLRELVALMSVRLSDLGGGLALVARSGNTPDRAFCERMAALASSLYFLSEDLAAEHGTPLASRARKS